MLAAQEPLSGASAVYPYRNRTQAAGTASEGWNPHNEETGRALKVAWMAGLFEGEGSIRAEGMRVELAMTDFDVVDRFHGLIKVGRISTRQWHEKWGKTLPQRRWQAGGLETIEALELLLPFLGERKTRAATRALTEFYASHTKICPVCRREWLARRTTALYCSERCERRRPR